MLAVRLDPDLEKRLAALAKKTGRSKSFYARAALEEYLEDLEDYFLAEERMKGLQPDDMIGFDDMMRKLDLED
ncbi:MAG: TraY domain-containing protein [Parasphingopyxis sp.]|nr:TraY domain-containing protein [Sphingomonadales bacterium]